MLPKSGVIRIANWSGGSAANPGIIVHNPNNNPEITRNVFFPFAISGLADQTVAAHLIENAVTYLFRDLIPVELTSFTANVAGNSVNLNWNTATELNNSGFEVERKSANSNYVKVGFVAGFGTTTEPKTYSFTENDSCSNSIFPDSILEISKMSLMITNKESEDCFIPSRYSF